MASGRVWLVAGEELRKKPYEAATDIQIIRQPTRPPIRPPAGPAIRAVRGSAAGYRAAEIGHVVIENALVRLACCQRTYGADRKIFIHAIVRGKRKNFADVIATSLVILPHHQRTNCVDEKGTSQSRRITKINCIIASLR